MPSRRGKTTVALLATSYVLSLSLIPGTERFNFLGLFLPLWAVKLLCEVVYDVFLYPLCFSPLR